MLKKQLLIQVLILFICMAVIGQWAIVFPNPGYLNKLFLPPKQRWPEHIVKKWAEKGNFDWDFWNYFTRDPERKIPVGNNIVAPADGELLYISKYNNKIFFVIAMSLWDVHVQRFPVDGVVVNIHDEGDTFMNGEHRDFVYLNKKQSPVQKVTSIHTQYGEFIIRQVTSLAAKRLQVYVKENERVKKGQRLGRILAGSTVILEIPEATPGNILVNVHDRVVAGDTILMRIN